MCKVNNDEEEDATAGCAIADEKNETDDVYPASYTALAHTPLVVSCQVCTCAAEI
jgi:hypothetical protein